MTTHRVSKTNEIDFGFVCELCMNERCVTIFIETHDIESYAGFFDMIFPKLCSSCHHDIKMAQSEFEYSEWERQNGLHD